MRRALPPVLLVLASAAAVARPKVALAPDDAAAVPHLWHVGPGGHDVAVWRQDLHHFARRLFR